MKAKNHHIILINIIINFFLLVTGNFILALAHFIGFIAYMIQAKRFKKKNKKHKKFDIKYFRDDLKKISPAYMSFLQDYEIDLNRDVTAHILKLYIDKYLELKNDKFVTTKKDRSNLEVSDILLLEYVESNFKDLNFFDNYKRAIKDEMFEEGYVTKAITIKEVISLASVFFINFFTIFFIAFLKINFSVKAKSILGVVLVIAIVIAVLLLMFAPVIFIARIIAYRNHGMIKRTKKGEELLEQIYGLKNFLKDFSIINDRKFEDVYLQEHYLVYAITLEVNTKVDDEILKKIKKQVRY